MKNEKISNRQFQALLVLDVFGTGVMFLPRIAASYTAQSGWVTVLFGTLIAIIYITVMTTLAGKFSGLSFSAYSKKILGAPLGSILSALFAGKIILSASFELRFFLEAVRNTLLNKTPPLLIGAVMVTVAAFAALKGYEVRARLAELLIFIVFIPLMIIFGIAAFQVDYSNLLPIQAFSPEQALLGGYRASFCFSGFEFCLLAFPFLANPKSAKKSALKAASVTGLMMAAITALTIARFGANSLRYQTWPVIEMADSVNLPGSFIERQGVLVMSFWIVSVFAIINAGIFFSSLHLKDISRGKRHSPYIIINAVLVLLFALLPESLDDTYQLYETVSYTLGIGFFLFVPLLLLFISCVRRLPDEKL